MTGAGAVLCVLGCVSLGAAVAITTDKIPQGGALAEERWIWDASTCTGVDSPPTGAPFCYSGTKLGESVTIKVDAFDHVTSLGNVFVTGSGLSPIKCSRSFTKEKELITVQGLEQCWPGTVKPSGLKYCSDQDEVLLNAKVGGMAVEMVLKPAPCPAVFLEEEQVGTRNDLLDHSAWVWDATACTGSSDPAPAPHCYSGSKMGEIVTIKVNSYDSSKAHGSVLVTGSGLQRLKCERGFAKTSPTEQVMTVDRLSECLPKTVKPNSVKYCSDQNQVILDAKVGFIPVQMTLIPAPCPTFLLEDNAEGVVLAETDSEWAWDATTCTGSSDPPTRAPFCYTGNKMGEAVTVKVDSFDSPSSAGSVLVAGSGLAGIHCKRSFSKAQQMLTVTGLTECLPKTVKPSGLKYCSDQDKVILDASIGLLSVEMVLHPATCPAAFLEETASLATLPSGAAHILRREH